MLWSLRKRQSPPDHRANAAQDDLELVNAQHLGPGMELSCTAADCTVESVFPNSLRGLAPTFLCSPFSGFHRADHRAVGFGYHMLAASGRQQAKRFLVLGFQLQARPFGLFQSRRPCCAGRDFKSVVLLALLRGFGKGMLGAKIAQHSIQWFRAPPIAHRDAGGEHSLIAAGRSAPYSLLYFDLPEYTPPIQPFFLRSSSPG